MKPSHAPSPDEKAPREPGEAPPPRKKKWWRRWLRRLFRIALVLLLLLLVFLLILPSIISSGWVRGIIVSKTGEILNRPVELKAIRFDWSGAFDLDGFSIGPKGDEPPQPLLAIEKVRARWGWAPLFSLKFRLDDCQVEGFRLTVARSKDGVWNLLTLIPPGPPPPPEPPTPPGEPFQLTEFPLEAFHVSLKDWQIDFVDEASTETLRAGFRMDSFGIDLFAPTAPTNIAMKAGLYLGDTATSLPMEMSMSVTPGAKGYLDWKNIQTDLQFTMPEQTIGLAVGPSPTTNKPSEPGIAVETVWTLTPSVFVDFAKRGLPMTIPAAVDGTISGRLRAVWDTATSASLTLGTTWHDFAVQADAMGPKPLVLGDLGVLFDVATNADDPKAPAWSVWDIRSLGFHAPFVQALCVGKVSGVSADGSPHAWITWDVRHDPATLEPIFAQLGIVLPEQIGILREVAYSGLLRGGMNEPIDMTGILETVLAPLGRPDEISRLGVVHEGTFDLAKDRLDLTVKAGEFNAVHPKTGDIWKSDPWMTMSMKVAPAMAANRRGAMKVVFEPGPLVDQVVALGFAPAEFPTTGSLTLDAAFAQEPAGDLSVTVVADGAVGVSPAIGPDSTFPMPLQGLKPLAFSLDKARLGVTMQPGRPMRIDSDGDARFLVAWDAPSSMGLALGTAFDFPARWTLNTSIGPPGPIDVAAQIESTPAVHLSGAFQLGQAQPIRAGMRMRFDPATSAIDLSATRLTVGDWLQVSLAAQVENFGQESIEAKTEIDVEWGEGLLSWIPREFLDPLGGLVTSGTTQVVLTADGRWDPARPDDSVKTRLDVVHVFHGITVGPADKPLVNGRDWNFRLGMDAAAAPGNLLQPVHLTAGAAMGHTDSLAMAALRDIGADVKLDIDPNPPMPVEWDMTALIGQIATVVGPVPARLPKITMGTKGQFDATTFDLDLKTAWAELGDLASARADARFTSATQELALHADATIPSIARWVRLPQAMIQDTEDHPIAELPWITGQATRDILQMMEFVPELDGSAGGAISVEGELPAPEDLKVLSFPMTIELSAHLDDFITTLPAPVSTTIRDLDQSVSLVWSGTWIDGIAPGSLRAVEMNGAFPYTLRDMEWNGAFTTDLALGTAGWKSARFTLSGLGISVGAEGSIGGWGEPLREMLDPKPNAPPMGMADWIAFAQNLVLRSRSSMVWESADWMTFAPSEAKGRGRVEMYSQLRQEPGREVESLGGVSFKDFSVRYDPMQVRLTGVEGSMEMLLAGRRDVAPPPEAPFLTDRLFNQTGGIGSVDPTGAAGLALILSPPRPDQTSLCRIQEIAFQQWAIRGITLRSEGDIRRWTVYVEIDDMLSGKVRGRMGIRQAFDGGWDLEMEGEITGLSGRSAFPAWRDLPADQTEINGAGSFRWHLAPDAKTPEELLRGIDIRFVVTRIGSRALQSFILALDPEEKNPSFVAGRQALNLGRPSKFVFTFRNGLMDMEAGVTTFAGIGFSIPLLKRAAVGELFRLDALQPQLAAVMMVRQGLDALKMLDRWATPDSSAQLLAEIQKP